MTKSVQIHSVTLTGMSSKNEEHIITSSNAGRRKLSFQGWEKCLEAFSQGRGVLSHHCSRLISQKNETGYDEEAISWSSSDSEFEEHTQVSRQRPNRTLSSYINFDDCVSARKGRRRQTHARFSRSIEKHLGVDSSVLNHSSQIGSHCSELQDSIDVNKVQESSHNVTSIAESQGSCAHSLSVCQDVSVLNQKIYLFNESELSQNVYSHDSPVASIPDHHLNQRLAPHNISEFPGKATDCDRLIIDSPLKSKWCASEACSPVLETRKIVRSIKKAHPKSPIIKTTRKKCGTKTEQSNKSQEFPFEIPVSPPLKLTSQVKKKKSLKLSKSHFSSMTKNEENKSISSSESNTQSDLDNCIQSSLLQVPVVNEIHKLDGKEDKVSRSPVKNTPGSITQNAYLGNEITSPIIGKKLCKVRRKQVPSLRSKVPRSPVLGSLRSPAIVKRTGKSQNAELMKEIQVVELTDDSNEKDNIDLGEPSPSLLLLPRWELEVFRKEPEEKAEGNSFESNRKSSVKRSLDFSGKCDVNECVQNIDSKEKTQHDICSDTNVEPKQAAINIAAPSNSSSRKIPKSSSSCGDCNDLQNESELIEDINTEQLNIENVFLKSPSSLNHRKKRRKTLSLGKKGASEIAYANNTSNQTCMIEYESQTQHIASYNPQKDLENRRVLQQNYLKEVPDGIEGGNSGCVSPVAHANFTHYIEEVNTELPLSESMRKVGLMVKIEHKLKSKFENKYKNDEKLKCSKQPCSDIFISQNSSNFDKEQEVESSATSDEGDADSRHTDIESIHSESPEKILLDPQIEVDRWTSSYTPSPVTISQSSSPAPVVDSITPIQDEFNAPPKKGRKKFKVGGLASRMQKLLNRHRSSVRVWQYKRSKVLSSGDNSNTGGQDTGTLLCVDRAWTEYSHVVLQCHQAQENSKVVTTQSGNALSGSLLVILDPYIVEKVGRIITAPMIRIFPPWQALKSKGVTVIISASFIELVLDLSPSAIKQCSSPLESEILKEFLCSCLSGADQGLCSLHPDLRIDVTSGSGKCKFVNLLFPEENHDVACLLSCVNGAGSSDHKNHATKSTAVRDTVAELVTCYSSAQTVSGWLSITILRIFQYKMAATKNKELELAKSSPTWSVLGRDAASELCEVVLGSSSSCCKSLSNALETGDAVGKICRFSNLIPVQRINPFRTSGLWGVVSNMPSFDSCEQSVLYIFAPAHDRLQYTLVGISSNLTQDLWQPKIISLRDILFEDNTCLEPRRASTICRLLHASSDRLYATDTQLSPRIIVISLKSTVYVTPTVLRGPLVLLVDLEVSSGEIKADKYTRIMTMDSYYLMENLPFSEEQCNSLASISPLLPMLKVTTAAHSLAMLTGTIVGVDEASAFMWPACSSCGNELLSVTDTQNESYHCENCKSYCEQLIFRMSLQVLVTCSSLPRKYRVRVQLLQESIEKLLPSAPSREGYEMDTVLGQKIGPLCCEVLSADGGNFTLQELPLL